MMNMTTQRKVCRTLQFSFELIKLLLFVVESIHNYGKGIQVSVSFIGLLTTTNEQLKKFHLNIPSHACYSKK